jgi:ABC-2 type transport system ATP-binding protein
MTPALLLADLSKSFGKPAVAGLSLAVAPGEFYALLGPNGAGKTTTLRMIAGLTAPDAGAVELFGVNVALEPERAKCPLAYVPDDPPLYGKLTPLEYLEFVGGLWSLPTAECAARGEALLRQLGLWDNAQQRCEEFSRGMKQKVALAGALVHQPRLLLLDEPLTGLDAHAARLVKDMLLDFVAAGGTIVLTTHILEVAERLAQRIGIIQHGRLIAEGTLDELRSRAGETQGTLEDVFLELTAAPQ